MEQRGSGVSSLVQEVCSAELVTDEERPRTLAACEVHVLQDPGHAGVEAKVKVLHVDHGILGGFLQGGDSRLALSASLVFAGWIAPHINVSRPRVGGSTRVLVLLLWARPLVGLDGPHTGRGLMAGTFPQGAAFCTLAGIRDPRKSVPTSGDTHFSQELQMGKGGRHVVVHLEGRLDFHLMRQLALDILETIDTIHHLVSLRIAHSRSAG